MTDLDRNQGGFISVLGRRVGRRQRAVIGLAGLSVALGSGAYVMTDQLTDGTRQPAAVGTPRLVESEPARSKPTAATNSVSTAPTEDATTPANASNSVEPAAAGTSPTALTVEQRLTNARAQNTRMGTGARPAMPPKDGGVVPETSQIRVVSSGSLKNDGKSLRVVSAPLDLAGQRELAWVSDEGEAYHHARCSQKIQMSNNVLPKTRPTLLICWRTSATRSAYTVMVDLHSRPSKAESVAALNQAWARLR